MNPGVKNPKVATKASIVPLSKPLSNSTNMARESDIPEDDKPTSHGMERTRVIKGGKTDEPESETDISSASKDTEVTKSRVLGKNLVRVGEFQLKRKLGEGAMGAVYLAEQPSFNNRKVALKILFPHVASNPKLVKRLEREAKAMSDLDHPNIVTAHAFDEADGFHYLAMEFVSGQSTQKWLNQLGKLPVGDALRITLDCASALAYAHSHNHVHRDIKPDNILLTKEGVVKVADLGMVKTHDEDMSLTQTGHAVGTPWYMPLEQARNAKEIDGRSDIYALGCMLYAFLTGKPPFVGATIVEVIEAKKIGRFREARKSNPDVPDRLDLIIEKMTAREVKDRYQTCAEVITDLESLNLANESVSFVKDKPASDKNQEQDDYRKLSATVQTKVFASPNDNTPTDGVPTLDPNTWYLQVKTPDGKTVARPYSTAQLQKMLADGVIKPSAKISHTQKEGFRALATYKEFQGQALSQATKTGADKQTSRYRNIYKKIEEKERDRDQKERDEQEPENAVTANARYWFGIISLGLPVVLGAICFISALYWVATVDATLYVPIISGSLFLASLAYALFGRRN